VKNIYATARRWARRLNADDRGAAATEYILVLTFVVLPIALLTPLFMKMIRIYGSRQVSLMGFPFP
jgi:Flp pilus assembly pilin Flp